MTKSFDTGSGYVMINMHEYIRSKNIVPMTIVKSEIVSRSKFLSKLGNC